MNIEERMRLYCESLRLLNKNLEWLLKSYLKAKNLELSKENLTEENLEALEALSNRFGRTVDILINKVLRGLDLIELEDMSTKLDTVIRAEKRGLIKDYRLLVEMKDLRNELSHEYIQENLTQKIKEILDKIPLLIDVIEKLNEYSKTKNYCKLP